MIILASRLEGVRSARLFLSKRGQRVDPCGAAGRDIAGHKSRSEKNERHADQRSDVHGADVVQQALQRFPNEVNAGKPDGHADQGGAHAFADDQFEDLWAASAEGNANSQLVISLSDREGHDAVNADGGQEQRQRGKSSEDEDGKAVAYEGIAYDLIHGADVRHGVIGIDRANGGGDPRGYRAGVSIGADADGGVGPGALIKRHINLGGAGGGMAVVLDIMKNAHNLPFDRRAEGGNFIGEQFRDFDALGERVEARQVLAGKAFADYCDPRSAG